MINDNRKTKTQAGVTLLELLIVITIIVVLSTLALMRFGAARQKFTRQNVAGLLKVALERARFDSVKRRAVGTSQQAQVEVGSTDFTLKTDANRDGDTTDAGDAAATDFAGQNVTLTVQSGTLPLTVHFNKRGEVVDAGGASISPVFLICDGVCDFTNDTSGNATILLVTPTGTVNMLAGGSAVPVFAPPSTTWAGSSSSGINDDVVVP